MSSARTLRALLLFATVAGATTVSRSAPAGGASAPSQPRIQRVESTLTAIPSGQGQAPLRLDLRGLMRTLHIPGVSVAVIDGFHVAWAKGYGVAEAGSVTPVTTTTLFQAASISKTLTAVAALTLVEQGKLSLDEDVNRKLTSWKVPENQFTKDQKVTLRRIMSHSAGLTVHGFPGYASGAPLPTLVQILNGEKPANTDPIRVDVVPGTVSRYSGGGVTVEQQLLMDTTGEPFPEIMRKRVLDTIGMKDSTFEQPLPAAKAASAASGTLGDGTVVPGQWHVYPEMAAAGLWTTPTDLAAFAIEIALSKHGKSNRVLSEASTRAMLERQIENVGLAFFLDAHNPDQFGHTGGNEGFQSVMIMLGDAGQGVVVMGNSNNLWRMEDYLIESIAKEYRWTYVAPKHTAASVLAIVAAARGTHAAIQTYREIKARSAADYVFDEGDLNQFGYDLLQRNRPAEALEAFELNVKEYPKSSNVYDSVAEAYMKNGRTELAIRNYETSLELNPKNSNATAMLDKLRAKGK